MRRPKHEKDKKKAKAKRDRSGLRLAAIPPNKRHKSKKDYKRVKKVDHRDYE